MIILTEPTELSGTGMGCSQNIQNWTAKVWMLYRNPFTQSGIFIRVYPCPENGKRAVQITELSSTRMGCLQNLHNCRVPV